MRHPAHSKHGGCTSFLPFQSAGEVAANWLGPITVLNKVDKCQINELHENVNPFLILFDSFFPPFFSPSLPFFFLPLFHHFFFLPTCALAPELQGCGSGPFGTCVGLHTMQVSYSYGGGFLRSLKIKKQRPGAISFILNDHAFLPPKSLNTLSSFFLLSCAELRR